MIEVTTQDRTFRYRQFDVTEDGYEMTESELLQHLGATEVPAPIVPHNKLVIYTGRKFIRVCGDLHELRSLFTFLEAKPDVQQLMLYRDDLLYWEYDGEDHATVRYLRDKEKIIFRCHLTGNSYHFPWSPLPQRPKAQQTGG